MAALSMERKVQWLGEENVHHRQTLAKVKSKFHPVPSGPCAPTAAFRGPEVLYQGLHCVLKFPRREEAHAGRVLRPGVTCRFDSTSQQLGGHLQPQQSILGFLP